MPLTRSAGSPTTAPTTAATSGPTAKASGQGHPCATVSHDAA